MPLLLPSKTPTRQIDALDVQKRILDREEIVGADHQEKLGEIDEQKTAAVAKLKALQERWDQERALVTQIRELRGKLEARPRRRTGAAHRQAVAEAAASRDCATPDIEDAVAALEPSFGAAGRDGADQGLRGCADRGRGALRVDRHSCRQDAQG